MMDVTKVLGMEVELRNGSNKRNYYTGALSTLEKGMIVQQVAGGNNVTNIITANSNAVVGVVAHSNRYENTNIYPANTDLPVITSGTVYAQVAIPVTVGSIVGVNATGKIVPKGDLTEIETNFIAVCISGGTTVAGIEIK